MRSSLSRRVCRQALASHGQPLPTCTLLGEGHVFQSLRPTRARRPLLRPPPRRTFLNLWKKAPRQIKDAGLEPGFGTFVEFRAHSVEGTRLPSRDELIHAWRTFFDNKLRSNRALNSSEAFVARLVLEYLQEDKTAEPALATVDMRRAMDAIAQPLSKVSSSDHCNLATALYREMMPRIFDSEKSTAHDNACRELNSTEFETYLTALIRFGGSTEASKKLSELESHVRNLRASIKPERLQKFHIMVLRGIATGRHASPEVYARKLQEDYRFGYTSAFHEIMTTYFAETQQDDSGPLQEWFLRPIDGGKLARPDAYASLLKFCHRIGHQPEWVVKAMQHLCDLNPPKIWWDVVLAWAVYQGKDIDHIKHMQSVMMQLNPGNQYIKSDVFTINGLIEAAVETKNAPLAERLNVLASASSIERNAQTCSLLLQARMIGQDKAGAASALEELLRFGRLQSNSQIMATTNAYIRHLCETPSTQSTEIVNTLTLVESQHGELDPETVAAVCLKFLKDDKTMDVLDTLGLHLKTFSMADRSITRSALIQYCLDKNISTARAWDGYLLVHQYFPETTKEERIGLMEGFFGRKRADMACNIFGHMRAHPDERFRPDLDTYVLCLEGLGAVPDEDSLGMVHNMFKMDTMIQPNVRLLNALMIAHTSCDQPRRAFDYWGQIANLPEGPTYKSLEHVFRACQKIPYGYDRAKLIWEKMQKLDVDIPENVYDAYTLMLAGQMELEKTKDMLLFKQVEYAGKLTPRL